MTRKQVCGIAEPLLFVLTICGAAFVLSSFECRCAHSQLRSVHALRPEAPLRNDRSRNSAPTLLRREFDATLAACATGDASACSKLDTLHQRLEAGRDRVASRSSTGYAR